MYFVPPSGLGTAHFAKNTSLPKDYLYLLCSREAFQFLKLSNRSDLEQKLTSLLAQLEGLEPCAQFADSLRHIQAGRS